jgi:hypothetical protein
VFLVALGLLALLTMPSGKAVEFIYPYEEVGMSPYVTQPDAILAGRFEGKSHRVGGQVEWKSFPSKGPRFVPMEAGFRVDSVVIGPQDLVGGLVQVRYAASSLDLRDNAFGDLATFLGGHRCLLQLMKNASEPTEYEILRDVNWMRAGPKPTPDGWAEMDTMTRLQYEFASAVSDPDATVSYPALLSVRDSEPAKLITGPVFVSALKKGMGATNQNVSLASVEALITVGDLDTIYDLKDIFNAWSKDPKKAGAQGSVGYFLEDVTDRNAVPALVELTSDTNPGVRGGATCALRHLGGDEVISALAARLSDENSDVRYEAMRALAEHMHSNGEIFRMGPDRWRVLAPPATDIYKKDPQTPVNNWKTWWQTNKAKYPPVDAMLKKAALYHSERPWAHKDAPTP